MGAVVPARRGCRAACRRRGGPRPRGRLDSPRGRRAARTHERAATANDARGASAARIRSGPRRNLGRGRDRAALPRAGPTGGERSGGDGREAVRSAMAVAVTVVASVSVPGAARAAPLSVHATTQPSAVGIGDAFTYVVDVRVDPALVDARSVTVVADGGPFAPLGDQVVSRSSTSVHLEQRLACLDSSCVPRGARRTVTVPPARARVSCAAAEGRRRSERRSPSRSSHGCRPMRCAPAAPATASRRHSHRRTTGRAGSQSPRALRRRCSSLRAWGSPRPRRGAGDVRLRRGRRGAAGACAPAPPRIGLARAPDRRRAADLLARVARTRGAPPLADEATRVAWSPEQPQPATATALADKADDGAGR